MTVYGKLEMCTVELSSEEIAPLPANNNIHKLTDEALKIQVGIRVGLIEYNRACGKFIDVFDNLHVDNLHVDNLHVDIFKCEQYQKMLALIISFNKNLKEHCDIFEISYKYNMYGNILLSKMNDITIECYKLCKT